MQWIFTLFILIQHSNIVKLNCCEAEICDYCGFIYKQTLLLYSHLIRARNIYFVHVWLEF